MYRQNISATAGDIVFEPVSGPGIYYIYYMPYRLTGRRNYPTAVYPRFRDQADPEWFNTWKHRHAPATSTDEIPKATSVRIEAVNPFNAMSPMEHPMSATEQDRFVRILGEKPFYLFPAGRKYPYILKKQLPKILENLSPYDTFTGTVRRGENYTFQIGLYVPEDSSDSLKDIKVIFNGLKDGSGHVISQESISSLNTQGIAYDGIPFSKHIDVAPGNLQPLWILIDVTSETVPGTYHGLVEVQPENEQSQSIEVQLEILEKTAEDNGVDEPWL